MIYRGVLYAALERAFGAVCAVRGLGLFTGSTLCNTGNNPVDRRHLDAQCFPYSGTRAFTGRLLPCLLDAPGFQWHSIDLHCALAYLESTPAF